MKIETATIRRLRDSLLQSGRRPSAVLTPAYETLTRQSLLSPEEMGALTRVDPLAETMFLMMAADERVTDVERDAVRGAIRGLTDDMLRSGTINVMLEGYEQRLQAQGRDARLREIADEIAEEPSEAEGAFSLAAAVALADDEVTDGENEFINQLAEWFGITEQRAGEILDQLEEDRATDPEL
jgi:tellurite resistance protein